MAKHRKFSTYVCLGAACASQVRLRVPAKRGPKPKPHGWRMTRARYQEADTGILREASVLFCSNYCMENPSIAGGLASRVQAYLGPPSEPPARVVYICVKCGTREWLENPQHTPQAVHLPDGDWLAVPLVAVDYGSGLSRMTTLPVCGPSCARILDGNASLEEQPELVQRELKRLFAGIDNEEKARVLGTIAP